MEIIRIFKQAYNIAPTRRIRREPAIIFKQYKHKYRRHKPESLFWDKIPKAFN